MGRAISLPQPDSWLSPWGPQGLRWGCSAIPCGHDAGQSNLIRAPGTLLLPADCPLCVQGPLLWGQGLGSVWAASSGSSQTTLTYLLQVLASLLRSRLSPVGALPTSQPHLEHIPQTAASSWPCLARGCCATSADPLRHWLPQYPDAGLCGAHETCGRRLNLQTWKLWAPAPPNLIKPSRSPGEMEETQHYPRSPHPPHMPYLSLLERSRC